MGGVVCGGDELGDIGRREVGLGSGSCPVSSCFHVESASASGVYESGDVSFYRFDLTHRQ
jgi:hypothetical protein